MHASTGHSTANVSLIPETLEGMASDAEFQQTAARLQKLGQAAITREEKRKRQRSLDKIGVPSFGAMVKVTAANLCITAFCKALSTRVCVANPVMLHTSSN